MEIVRVFAHWPRDQRYVLIWRNIDTNWVSEYQSSLSSLTGVHHCTVHPLSQPLMYSLLYSVHWPYSNMFRCLHSTIPLVTHNCLNVLTLLCFAKMSFSNEVSSVLSPGFYLVISRIHYFWLKLPNEGQNYNWERSPGNCQYLSSTITHNIDF